MSEIRISKIEVSIIIPVYNEERNIFTLNQELVKELSINKSNYELVYVDDNSKDNSGKIIESICRKQKNTKLIKLKSNYGQSTAISAGIDNSKGKIIVTMDSDLQHDSRDISPMIKKINKGFDVVCGWRKYRGDSDSFVKKTIPSKISNFLINRITKLRLHDSTGGMRAFKREVIDNINLYGELHRYLPILAAWKGFKVTECPIHIRKRKYGKTKYDFTRIFRGFLDLLTIKYLVSYSARPIQIFGKVGFGTFFLGFLTGSYILYDKIINGVEIISEHQPLLMLVILLVILGVNFLCFGFLADMISYDSVKKEKHYIIDKRIDK